MKPIVREQGALTAHYARYRAQLCQADGLLDERLRGGRMERVSFAALSRSYDLLLLDAFGVLNRGREAIAGAGAAVERLNRAGRPWVVLSNNGSQSPERLTRQLHDLGLAVRPSEVLTSGLTVRPFIAHSPWHDLPYYLIGTDDSAAAYAPEPGRLCVNHRAGEGWRAARYILLCSNRDYYGSLAQQRVEGLLEAQRLPVIVVNPDLVTRDATGALSVVAGYTAAEWHERYHPPWVGLGKPFSPLYALARHRFPGIAPDRCLMVGDTLDTDILGGAAQGMATCLTLSGSCAGEEETIETLCIERGICPDFIVQSIAT